MSDSAKILKLLNLTSSTNDAEALAALRMAQKYLEKNLGDFLSLADNGLSKAAAEKDELYEELEALFEDEIAKVSHLKKQLDDKDKSLRKRERDVANLKRDIKAYELRIEDYEKELGKLSAKASAPDPYEDLVRLYDAEVEKNDRLKKLLDEKDKALYKSQRDITRLKRDAKSFEGKVEEFEKTIHDMTEELIAFKNAARRS